MARRPAAEKALSLGDILETAVAIIDESGLGGFTMRVLADRLGVYPTAIYWHTGSKDRLLALATSNLFTDVVSGSDASQGWEEQLHQVGRGIRTAIRNHPNLTPIIGSRISVSVADALPYVEGVLGLLARAGFTDDRLVHAYNTFTGAVMGWAVMESSQEPEDAGDVWAECFQAELANLAPALHPNTAKVLPRLANNGFLMRWESGRTHPLDSSFDALLETLIRGFASELSAR